VAGAFQCNRAVAKVTGATVDLIYRQTLQLKNESRGYLFSKSPIRRGIKNKLRLDYAIARLQAEFIVLVSV